MELLCTEQQPLEDTAYRYFSGICCAFSQGNKDDQLTGYHAEIVPKFWLLTRQTRCRIFQRLSVPAILKSVLEDLDVRYDLRGVYEPREYCVQYRETDFYFASRLMEEEGIYHFFEHHANGHVLVVCDSLPSHPPVPRSLNVRYEAANSREDKGLQIYDWVKRQSLRSGRVTLWDSNFQMPRRPLRAQKKSQDKVSVGTVTHNLHVGHSQKLAALRMAEETADALVIQGSSNCYHFIAGSRFVLQYHFDGNGLTC